MKIFFAAFISIFLKSMQQQNVIGGHYVLAVLFSFLMAGAEIMIVYELVKNYNSWGVWLWMGTGAALGGVTGMYVHRKYIRRKEV